MKIDIASFSSKSRLGNLKSSMNMQGRKLGHPGGDACRDARAATWDGHIPTLSRIGALTARRSRSWRAAPVSDFEVAASERRAHPVLDTALPVAGAAPATTIQEHEVQPGAIPKASFMEAALLSGEGSRLPVASRNRCRVHDLPDLSDNKCRGVRETDSSQPQVCLPPRTLVESTFEL